MNTRVKILSAALLAAMALGLTACAPRTDTADKTAKSSAKEPTAQVSQDPLNKVQYIITTQTKGGLNATKLFDIPGVEGVKGVVVEGRNGQNPVLGVTNLTGDVFVPGPILNAQGVDITPELLEKFGGIPSAQEIAGDLQGAGFVAGKSGPIVTAFFEPYCGYCNKFFEQIAPKIDAGEVRVRFLMVGFLAEDSLARASDIINAKDPYAALKKWEETKDKSKVASSTASESDKAKVMQNNLLMNKARQSGTPALAFCSKSGGVKMLSGLPQDFNGFINDISSEGHPFCSTP